LNRKVLQSLSLFFLLFSSRAFWMPGKPRLFLGFLCHEPIITMKLYGKEAKAAGQEIENYMAGLEKDISLHREGSEVSRLNGGRKVSLCRIRNIVFHH
jgi:hypothetical protein